MVYYHKALHATPYHRACAWASLCHETRERTAKGSIKIGKARILLFLPPLLSLLSILPLILSNITAASELVPRLCLFLSGVSSSQRRCANLADKLGVSCHPSSDIFQLWEFHLIPNRKQSLHCPRSYLGNCRFYLTLLKASPAPGLAAP